MLLVEDGYQPPTMALGVEDWIRVPADERDLFARMARLERRYRVLHPRMPTLDDLVLRNGERWVALSPIEAAIVGPLVNNFGRLVTHEEIGAAAWKDGVPRSFRSRLHHLRTRAAEVGLRISTVRQRGFVLEFAPEDPGGEGP
jgi:DNA-binding response OmpR family regulator